MSERIIDRFLRKAEKEQKSELCIDLQQIKKVKLEEKETKSKLFLLSSKCNSIIEQNFI